MELKPELTQVSCSEARPAARPEVHGEVIRDRAISYPWWPEPILGAEGQKKDKFLVFIALHTSDQSDT